MKKIFAILISLLFVASVFGVAQTMAQGYDCNNYYQISRNSAKVGDIITISILLMATGDIEIEDKSIGNITTEIDSKGGLPYQIGPLELINVEYLRADWTPVHIGFLNQAQLAALPDISEVVWVRWTFRAFKPGTMSFTSDSESHCDDTETITVTPKSLPIDWIMKKFGLGKFKK